jgi:hypothetical protein
VVRQRKQHFVNKQDVLKVVDDTLPVEEIHSSRQEVPIQRFSEPQVLLLIGDTGDSDDFLKRDDLDASN